MSQVIQARATASNPALAACASTGTLAGGFALMAERTLHSNGSYGGALAMGAEVRVALLALVLVAAAALWMRLGRGRAAGLVLLGFGLGAHALVFIGSVAMNWIGWGEALGTAAGWIVLVALLVHLGTGVAAAVRLWREG